MDVGEAFFRLETAPSQLDRRADPSDLSPINPRICCPGADRFVSPFLLGSEIDNDKSQMHRVSPQRGWCRMIARANRVLSFLRLPGLWALTAYAEILPDISVETSLTDVLLFNHSPFSPIFKACHLNCTQQNTNSSFPLQSCACAYLTHLCDLE